MNPRPLAIDLRSNLSLVLGTNIVTTVFFGFFDEYPASGCSPIHGKRANVLSKNNKTKSVTNRRYPSWISRFVSRGLLTFFKSHQ